MLVIQDLNYFLKHVTTNFFEYSYCCHFAFNSLQFIFLYCTEFVIIELADIFVSITYV